MMCYGVITTITIFCRQLKSERLPQPVNHKNAAPVWDVFVGVWINVLLGQTKVHNEHHLVLLHAGPTSQVHIRKFEAAKSIH